MEDMAIKMELMQEQINALGDCVKAQTGTINTLLEIVQSLKQHVGLDVKIPSNIIYFNPKE